MKKVIIFIIMIIGIGAGRPFAKEFVVPKKLEKGAKVAIITPSSAVDSMAVERAINFLLEKDLQPLLYGHVYGQEYGTFAANDTVRAQELMAAFKNPDIDAILCSRGGYGTVRMLPLLDLEVIKDNPKWLIGYSDISNLHAVMNYAGVASIHGPMCGHLGDEKADSLSKELLIEMITQDLPSKYKVEPHPYDNPGAAEGILIGGNFITINGLAETEYDILNLPEEVGSILYLEEVGEQMHAVERMLMRLHQSGALAKYRGLVIGQFTEYKPTKDFETIEDMIHYWLKEWGYYDLEDFPILFGFPAGHGEPNYPLILNANTSLKVGPEGSVIEWK